VSQEKIAGDVVKEKFMNKMKNSKMGFVWATAFLVVLTGCVGYVEEPRHARVYAPAPPVYVEQAVVVQDDYVYYPSYQVYYSSSHHNYIYLEGRSWVTRPSPPRVSVDVLFRSPSVRVDFHDSPSAHHSRVVRQYPKHWSPPGHNKDGRDDQGDGRGDRGNSGNNGNGHK
jgi:hypothetical protein